MASLGIRRTYAAALAIAVLAAAHSAMAASFDGDWSLLVQSPDHCGTTIWNIAIRDGQVYYPEGFISGYPVGIAGLVSPSGVIRVNVAFGPRYATGVGRLRQLHGSGRWSGVGPSGTCAGVWTATRVTAYHIGADFGYRLSGRARPGHPDTGISAKTVRDLRLAPWPIERHLVVKTPRDPRVLEAVVKISGGEP